MPNDDAPSLEEIDRQLLDLLEARAKRSLDAQQPEAAELAKQRLHRLLKTTKPKLFPRETARQLMTEAIHTCAALRAPMRIAYFGPGGTFTHMAARRTFGAAHEYNSATSIGAVFEEVERGHAERGVVPIENSTEGGVAHTLDCLLTASHTLVVAEVALDVEQCLVGLQHDFDQIRIVYSHPQGLAQCRNWLGRNLPHAEQRASASTSAAALETATDRRVAAIGSELAAQLAGVEIIQASVQDQAHNVTRFLVLGKDVPAATGRDKTSIVFSTAHRRGALKRVLDVFDAANLNLTRIESRPGRDRLWEYVFFVDVEGHKDDPTLARALEALDEHCGTVKFLGSYPRSERER